MAGDDVKKPAVPKFASFKPKPATPPPPPPKPHSHRQHHHSHHRPAPEKRDATPRDEPLFTVDKRGDPLIVKYGSNDRAKVPAYRRSGAGRLLGAHGRLRLLYDGSKEMFTLGDRPGEDPSAFRDRHLLSKASRTKSRVFRLRPDPVHESNHDPDKEADFVPLSGSRHQKPSSRDAVEDHGPDYRSIQGKAKARDFVDSDLESADTSDEETDAAIRASNPARQRSADLSRHLKENPGDVDAWLELVDLQATLLGMDENAQQDRTSDEAKGLASMRVSLLEEALSNIRDTSHRERLLLRLMREGSRAWTNKQLAKRWADLKLQGSSFSLWKAHLNHELCQMTTFTYDGLRSIHLERMRLLTQQLFDAAKMLPTDTNTNPSDQLIGICDEIVYVFTRLTCFLRDAGYSELAVAAWQGALDLAFAPPGFAGRPEPDDLKKSLQAFWESEVPRVGEVGAQGWRDFDPEDISDAPYSSEKPALPLLGTRDVYKAWAAVEKHQGQNAALPARTLDEGVEDDPFRIVMFSDLEPLLLSIPPSVLERTDVKATILDAFLLFCRLPTASGSCRKLLREMRADPYIIRQKTGLDEADFEYENHTGDGIKKPPKFSDPGRQLCPSNDVLFAGKEWFGLFTYDASPEYELALTVTTQLATNFEFEPISEYSLGLAWNKDPARIRKVAKALIRKWPNNTKLYASYAVAEWRHGNRDVARTVLQSSTSQDLPGKEVLWTTWAWLDWEAGDAKSALARCVAAAGATASQTSDEASATHAQLLKGRQILSSSRGFLLSVGNLDQAAWFAQAGCLLEYLSDFVDSPAGSTPSRQGNMDAAMDVMHTFTTEAADRGHAASPALERLLQWAAHLLYTHATRGPFRPTHLREQLRRFVLLFPANTVFLRLFAWADTSPLLLRDPVRDLLRDPVLAVAHDCVTSRVFALQHEARAGTVHSVAAAFERALVGSDACRGNVGLWLDYVRFCHHRRLSSSSAAARKADGNQRAKDVYYRAIGSCPWSKELATEAFALEKGLDAAELQSVFHTLTGKGLRVHVDLEDFVANWSRRKQQEDKPDRFG